MKVNRLVVMLVVAVALIAAGVWFGVHLTQKNNQPVVAIRITKNGAYEQKNADFLLLNRKNKVIFAQFANQNFENIKIVGEIIDEFVDKFFKQKSQDKNAYLFEIYGEQHQNVLDIKKQIKKHIYSQAENERNNIQIDLLTNTQTTNLSQKYQKFVIDNDTKNFLIIANKDNKK